VAAAQRHIADGYRWVVDIDLEKFFDRVNHDRLMAAVAKRVQDKRLLKLIRTFLNAGVMESIDRFIHRKLKLKVNAAKSAVGRPWERKFLGFTFTAHRQPKRRIAPKALSRFARKVRKLTRRTRGISVETMVEQLATYLRGWGSYFGFCQTSSVLDRLNSWIQRRLRSFMWKQWKRGRRRFAELRRMGVGKNLAAQTAGSSHGPWHISRSPALSYAMPGAFWEHLGLPRLHAR